MNTRIFEQWNELWIQHIATQEETKWGHAQQGRSDFYTEHGTETSAVIEAIVAAWNRKDKCLD